MWVVGCVGGADLEFPEKRDARRENAIRESPRSSVSIAAFSAYPLAAFVYRISHDAYIGFYTARRRLSFCDDRQFPS